MWLMLVELFESLPQWHFTGGVIAAIVVVVVMVYSDSYLPLVFLFLLYA